jgi:hypothetical protein
MSDQASIKGSPFEDQFWLHGGSLSLRPTLGQIGLQQFAPYLINRISLNWTTHLASALKAHDMTTTQMRALAVLSISSPVTINELSQFALTEQSTMSRTLDALEEQAFIVRKPRPEDLRVRDVEITSGWTRRLRYGLAHDVRAASQDVRRDRQRGIQSLHGDDAQDVAEHS